MFDIRSLTSDERSYHQLFLLLGGGGVSDTIIAELSVSPRATA